MPLYDAVKDLTLTIESVELEPHVLPLKHITRRTTVVHLHGAGEEGVGEDVSYEEALQLAFTPDALPDLAGEHTLDSFSALVDGQPGYRQWGLESAALDLALRQAGRSLADAVGREPAARHVRRLAERRRGAARALPRDPLQARRERQVDGRGRRRARRDRRRRRRRLQGPLRRRLGRGDTVGRAVRPCRRGVPEAWLEDARIDDETRAALEPHRERLTWDFPIHSVDDVEALEWPPRCLNSKPSRFGSVRRLFDFYDHCAANGIEVYGGGQFELGPGRGQIQHLASLFHPDAPNDVAPKEYNDGGPRPGLPQSPLPPASSEPGFR